MSAARSNARLTSANKTYGNTETGLPEISTGRPVFLRGKKKGVS
jgi:hypothetical protein